MRKILILDDDAILLSVFSEVLKKSFLVTTIDCPLQAIDLLKSESFDVVITDYRMPKMSGLSFYNEILKFDSNLAPRIIFLTGDVASLPKEVRASNHCCEKLIKSKDLVNLINSVLQNSQQLAKAS